MTPRERNLLAILLIAAASVGLLFALEAYLDGLTRLDADFIALQKRALRVTQASVPDRGPEGVSSLGDLKERFFAAGTLPEALAMASRVQASLKVSGLRAIESRVSESSDKAQWIQYRVEGDIESWFRFLQSIRRQDARSLFRSLSLLKKEDNTYSIAFEVGHAVLQ